MNRGVGKATHTPRQARWRNTPLPASQWPGLILKSTSSTPTQKEGKNRRKPEHLKWKRGRRLTMPAGRRYCRPKPNPRRSLEGEGRARSSAKLTIPEMQSSPKNAPPPEAQSRRERSGGPLRNRSSAGNSQAPTLLHHLAQDRVPRIRTRGTRGAMAATKTA